MTTVGSLCSGIGGLDLAVCAYYGADVAWHAETDSHARQVLARHWPGTPNLGDVTTVEWGAVPKVDIITAGYPCQPFSQAGRRQGEQDERHLWPYIFRAICLLRPTIVVLENVPGHVSLGLPRVLADLCALRFDAEWGTVRASDIGASHRRERLFVVAHADGAR